MSGRSGSKTPRLTSCFSIKPRLYVKFGSDLYFRAHKHLRFLKRTYRPAWWAPNGLVQTIVRSLRSKPSLPWTREIVEFADGGCTAIDWLHPKTSNDNTPVLVLLPGITGSTHDASYLLPCAEEAHEKGWRVVVIVPRGLGGIPLKTPKTYNAAYTEDVAHIMEHMIAGRYPHAKRLGCGFSMGGMILWNYLATRTTENAFLHAAMSVSSPFDPHAATRALSTPIPKFVLNRSIAKCLIQTIAPHKEMLEQYVDWEWVCKSETIGDFDTRFTAVMGGYRDLNHYYEEAALYTKVHKIPIPFLVLSALDDHFAPIEAMPLDKFTESENVMAVITAHGGHTAFMESGNIHKRGFVERVLSQWTDLIVEDKQ